MISKTFYVYDDTFNARENAVQHVYQHLLAYDVESNVDTYKVDNGHPAGYDCWCVEVLSADFKGAPTFTGNTKQTEENEGDSWVCPNMLLAVADHRFYHGSFYFDGDRMCGVRPRIKKAKKKRKKRKDS